MLCDAEIGFTVYHRITNCRCLARVDILDIASTERGSRIASASVAELNSPFREVVGLRSYNICNVDRLGRSKAIDIASSRFVEVVH